MQAETEQHPIEVRVETSASRTWIGLAVSVLLLAGAFAILLVVARTPPFDRFVGDPGFFRRCLVVHVDLSLVAWFHAFAMGVVALLPSRKTSSPAARIAPWIAIAGILAITAAAGASGAQPLMANYVPVVDHPLFAVGLVVFASGIAIGAVHAIGSARTGDIGPTFLPPSARIGGIATAVALLLAVVTFYVSWANRPTGGVDATVFYELVMWGGGHVLQLASTSAMLTCWMILLASATGRDPLSRWAATGLFVSLLAPWTIAPILAGLGTQTPEYRVGFTRLMQLGIAPAVVAAIVLCVLHVRSAARETRSLLCDPRVLGFVIGAALTIVGFVLGAVIRGSNTIVPGHYHASIGAVTATFMATAYLLFAHHGLRVPEGRLARVAAFQPLVFGAGQLIFAAGFALAGSKGMMRKTYGAEQHARSLVETIGLSVMGTGGAIAIVGGVVFLVVAIAAWRAARPERSRPAAFFGWWRHRWQKA